MQRIIHPLTPLAALLFAALFFVSCQSPTETPPAEQRAVTVQVQNDRTEPLALVPVEMYDGTRGEIPGALLDRAVTDQSGRVLFRHTIPTTGANMLFVVGDENTGKIRVSANLLCRDTVLVIPFVSQDLPCTGIFNQLLSLKACSPNRSGATFSDSSSMLFRSSCVEALSISYTTATPIPGVRMIVLDKDGREVTDNPFLLPPRGSFSVRAIGTPGDSGSFTQTTIFHATGPNNADITLNVRVDLIGDNCNKCDCPKDTTILNFGLVQVAPEKQTKVQQVALAVNTCQITRRDVLEKGPSNTVVFALRSTLIPEIRPQERQFLSVEFMPKEQRVYRDTIIIRHTYQEENKTCLTRIILTGEGCGPICQVEPGDSLFPASGRYTHRLGLERARAYEGSIGEICLRNTGKCGTLRVTGAFDNPPPGFSVAGGALDITPGSVRCFSIRFDARDEVVWPNGHGQPARIDHNAEFLVNSCNGISRVNVTVRVDTIPILFSRCVYQWNQNGMYGYNFTPVEGKGEDRYDPGFPNTQLSDIVVDSVMVALGQAGVHVKSGWKPIKSGVTEAQFNFDDMSKARNGWTRAQYLSITDETGFTLTPVNTTFVLRSVYSIRVERGGVVTYACIRVREISEDGDGKRKICIDVLYPMINE
ncbi:MAG: hypothetical protein HY962_04390 [Ignavibacteriae bacterium]|nr:hypothetical protein [Ignavibacteriota bacterium]